MSTLLIQIFACMFFTFLLGLALGWVFWRHGGSSSAALASLNSEVDFWRSRHEQSSIELSTSKSELAELMDAQAKPA